MALEYKAIDVDNHYYEPLDAFTRHLDKKFKRRGVQMLTDGKRTFATMGERVNHFIPNPTFDPIIVPGCLDLLFRGEIPEGVDPASLMKVERLADHPDRKSTRLNSSHVAISYAVFCLKKKMNIVAF